MKRLRSLCIASTVLIGCSIEGDNSSNPLLNKEVVDIYDMRAWIELRTPSPAIAGEGIAWWIWVQNVGPKTVRRYWLAIWIDGRRISSCPSRLNTEPGVLGGWSKSIACGRYHFTPQNPGIYEYRMEVILYDVEDINPSNNVITGTIKVIERPPDFQPPEVERPAYCSKSVTGPCLP